MRPRPDAAENRLGLRRQGVVRAGFNEAAARCRGKHGLIRTCRFLKYASMRPRPDAAENAARAEKLGMDESASMRPRPDAAENMERAYRDIGYNHASMRPRPDAAENEVLEDQSDDVAALLQ